MEAFLEPVHLEQVYASDMVVDGGSNSAGSSLQLAIASVLGFGAGLLIELWDGPTGDSLLDGGLAVIIGLYVCSHPAINVVRLLLQDLVPASSGPTGRGPIWLLLNISSVIAGWFAIAAGLTAFFQ